MNGGHPALPPGLTGAPVYLDYNATTPVDPRVAEAMWPHLTDFFGSPSSSHHYSAEPRRAPAEARAQVAALVGARADEAVFTASGSEADLLALCGTALAHGCGALFHCDAAQAVGKIPLDVEELGVDLLTVVGHKMCAPKGAAALYVRDGLRLEPVVHGGGQEHGVRAGTENVALAVALGAAGLAADDLADGAPARIAALRDELHQSLAAALPGCVRLNGPERKRLPNTLNVSIDDALGHELLAAAHGIATSAGSACHRGNHTPFDLARSLGALRLSLGRWSTADDIETTADAAIKSATER
ncbi:aminotransferase class V-fold PLP-dependent enzyme [Streptomyces sp. NPDC005970]|uniref:cysteine desulfurase family protein n=1 Tax=Streptomyces sp. NPDC005970 TaxID=3156723 RepID=UPI0033F2F5A6